MWFAVLLAICGALYYKMKQSAEAVTRSGALPQAPLFCALIAACAAHLHFFCAHHRYGRRRVQGLPKAIPRGVPHHVCRGLDAGPLRVRVVRKIRLFKGRDWAAVYRRLWVLYVRTPHRARGHPPFPFARTAPPLINPALFTARNERTIKTQPRRLFGTVVGGFADKYGRKANTLLFVVLYSIGCLTKHFNSYWILMLGRLMGGISTSILYSAFETWMIHEHKALGFPECVALTARNLMRAPRLR